MLYYVYSEIIGVEDMSNTATELATTYTYEELAHALYLKGFLEGFQKVTDKTKWREPVMADKLGHVAHTKISAGAGSAEYGSDAFDPKTGNYAEYKSSAINDNDETTVRKLLNMPGKGGRKNQAYKIGGIYNGAYKDSAIEAYSKIDHYFGVFFQEKCVMIARIKTSEVIRQLTENNANRGEGKTTNLNAVAVSFDDTDNYEIVYDNREQLREAFFGN